MTTYTEKNNLSDVVKREHDPLFTREYGTLESHADHDLDVGAVLGQVLSGAVTADGGNTGDGTAGAVTFGARAKLGVYTLTCTAAATNAGTFEVIDPDGLKLPDLEVGTAYDSDHIKLTISDGGTDFIVGDKFTVDVTGGKYHQYDPAATDGTAKVAGILTESTDASSADQDIVVLARGPAVLADDALVWKSGLTADQKTTATRELEALGLVTRTAV